MRYRLRTLLIALSVAPPLLAGAWGIWRMFGVMSVIATAMTWVGFVTVIALLMKNRF
jgi:hypothetical protein